MAEPRWDDLRVFLHVARAESLSAGARSARLDPATLSRRIARLEADLNARLFVKGPQGYALTDAGQKLLAHVEAMSLEARRAQGEVQDVADRISGTVRVGAPDGAANYLLPQVTAEIAREHPGLDIQIVALPRVLNISKREVDMALTVSPPSAGRLTVQKVSDYHLCLAAHRDWLARHGPVATRADLAGHRLVGYIGDLIFDAALDYMDELGEGLRVALSSNSSSVQVRWVAAAAGIGILHAFALPAHPGLVPVLRGEVWLRRSFHLVRHADDRRVERLNVVASLLSQKIRREIRALEAEAEALSLTAGGSGANIE